MLTPCRFFMIRNYSISELGDTWWRMAAEGRNPLVFGLGDQFSKYIKDIEEIQRIQHPAFRISTTMHSLIYNVPRFRVRALTNTNSEIANPENSKTVHVLGMLAVFVCLLAILIGCLI